MAETLGISVTSQDTMPHVLGLAKAARAAGKGVEIFLTGEGVHLTQNPRFPELLEAGRVGLCRVSYIANGYEGKEVPGLTEEDFIDQIRNAELVAQCDRYLIL